MNYKFLPLLRDRPMYCFNVRFRLYRNRKAIFLRQAHYFRSFFPKLSFVFLLTYRESRGLEVRGGMAVALNRKAIFLRQAHSDERHTGIEPASSAWEADALPMC